MRICFLTQTADELSEYYKEFFKGKDLFFLTFRKENSDAIAYLPKSTWSEGRNRLWDEVAGKYDYYIFMDDDLIFYEYEKRNFSHGPFKYLYRKFFNKDLSLHYKPSKAIEFFNLLEGNLRNYSPEIASVTQLDDNLVNMLDKEFIKKGRLVRRTGFFDAQFTVISNFGASKILPYDTKISGWLSAQILFYFYAFHVFKKKSINMIALGVKNSHHVGAYVENYEGLEDCRKMIRAISTATKKDYHSITGLEGGGVDYLYGSNEILDDLVEQDSKEDYIANFDRDIKGIGDYFHKNLNF